VSIQRSVIGAFTQGTALALFVLVLAIQAGVPVPAAPSLLVAGALAGSGHVSFSVILAVVVGAALSADLIWYSLGRWRGAQTLAVFRRRVKPHAWVERVERLFLAHRFPVLFGARFLPAANPVGAGLAGAAGMRPATFLLSASGSALIWAGAWAGAGYLLSNVIVP
jgi:membrane protein DedA with SNARE-associated domain